ncbi:MAG: type II toxin-antitoxin system HicB family antitoxin [Clostridia bacterium]|nr:type II toxin-antitoxin system HicB family antitoxin [Clostridia bacterium]
MTKKPTFNLCKVDSSMFNSKMDIDEFVTEPENSKEIEKQVEQYAQLEYPIKLQKESDEHGMYWVAEHQDLPGCMTHGNTKEEALINLDDAKRSWIYTAVSLGTSIPDPGTKAEIEDCSGRILLRLPKELHYRLLQKSKEDNISLNQELLFLISSALGIRYLSSKKKQGRPCDRRDYK